MLFEEAVQTADGGLDSARYGADLMSHDLGTVTERGDEITVTRVGVGISSSKEHSANHSEHTNPDSSVIWAYFIPTLRDTMLWTPVGAGGSR